MHMMGHRQKIDEIHKRVSRMFRYTYDDKQYLGEHWPDVEMLDAVPEERGAFKDDCDGFALMCRSYCREEEIPTRLVYCLVTPNDYSSGHLVLEAFGWILDNRQRKAVARDTLDYQWLRISGYGAGDPWHEIYTGSGPK